MNTATKPLTCAERIADELASTESYIAAALAAASNPDADEYQEGVEVYSIRRTETIQLQLSGGGPADYVEIIHREGDILSVWYRFSDWFDTATLQVREDSPVYEWALLQFELLREVGE
jgi:hypothetical protein